MIHVDVIIPDLDRKYEFCCDETVKVSLLTEQMVICVEKTEAVSRRVFMEEPWLFSRDRETDLNPQGSLADNGVKNGMTLLLL